VENQYGSWTFQDNNTWIDNATGKSMSTQEIGAQFASSGADNANSTLYSSLYHTFGFFESIYGVTMEGLPSANPGFNNFGTGLSILNTGWTGYDLYQQHKKNNIENVNPFQFGQFLIGSTALLLEGASSIGYGGSMSKLIVRGAGMAGVALSSLEVLWMFHKGMNDLRFAPNYIDINGNPVYNYPDFYDPFKANYSW